MAAKRKTPKKGKAARKKAAGKERPGWKVLNRAISAKDTTLVGNLLSQGALTNEFVGEKPPLHHAAGRAHVDIVKLLIDTGASVDGKDPLYGSTPLMDACEACKPDTVRALIDAGADVNLRDEDGLTPLDKAVQDRTDSHLQVVQALIAAGANVNCNIRFPLLMAACEVGSLAMIHALIAAGADVNAVVPLGTALTTAVEENRPDVVSGLLQAGADINVRITDGDDSDAQNAGKTAWELAVKLRRRKIVKLIESAGAATESARASKEVVAPTVCKSIAASWKWIEAWLAVNAPAMKASLRKGVSRKKIENAEAKLGMTLPEDYKESFRIHDGQSGSFSLFPAPTEWDSGYFLLSLDRVVEAWQMWNRLLESGDFEKLESGPDQGIRDDWWNPRWIPVTSNGAGDYHCIDLAPTSDGRIGQVITMWHESPKRELVAWSFAQWLGELIKDLECAE